MRLEHLLSGAGHAKESAMKESHGRCNADWSKKDDNKGCHKGLALHQYGGFCTTDLSFEILRLTQAIDAIDPIEAIDAIDAIETYRRYRRYRKQRQCVTRRRGPQEK